MRLLLSAGAWLIVAGMLTQPADADPPQPYRVVAAGDWCGPDRNSRDRCRDVAEMIENANGAYYDTSLDAGDLLGVGDLDQDAGTYGDYLAGWDAYASILNDRMHPVPGNHEYRDPEANAAGYRRYWPSPWAPATGPLYYTFSGRDPVTDDLVVEFIALDTTKPSGGGPGISSGSAQYEWFRDEVDQSQAPCLVVYGHHPRWATNSAPPSGSRGHGSETHMNDVWKYGADDGVDIWIAGHVHHYERFNKMNASGSAAIDGVQEFVVGTGGDKPDPFSTMLAANSAIRIVDWGALFLTFETTSTGGTLGDYSWVFRDRSGDALDSGEGSCTNDDG